MKPSAKIIYDALLRGETLTPIQSLTRYGIHALSQRIGEIKKETGENIISKRMPGYFFHIYYIGGHNGNL